VGGIVSLTKHVDTIAVDSIGVREAAITHGLYRAPLANEVQITYNRETNVADYVIGQSVTQGSNSTVLNVRTSVRAASGTPGATVQRIVVIDLSR
jgi:hypothetical protein